MGEVAELVFERWLRGIPPRDKRVFEVVHMLAKVGDVNPVILGAKRLRSLGGGHTLWLLRPFCIDVELSCLAPPKTPGGVVGSCARFAHSGEQFFG